ncbi:MAG TPA: sulfatase-like hydrolase/transferase [Natronosporangium sp.]
MAVDDLVEPSGAEPAEAPGVTEATETTEPAEPGRRARVRRVAARVLTGLAAALLLFALVVPNQPSQLTPAAFLRIPAEGLIAAGLLLALPANRWRRLAAVLLGIVIGALLIVKTIDIGFFGVLDRPFDLVLDWPMFGPTVKFLADSYGETLARLLAAAAVLLAVAVLVLMPLALLRVTPLLVRWRTRAAGVVGVLAAGWVAFALAGVQIVPGVPLAAHNAGRFEQVYDSLRDAEVFATQLAHDEFRYVPDDRLLTALRGKDVVLAFVESYGRSVVDPTADPELAAGLTDVLADGDHRLTAAGFSTRSGFLTSPTAGGGSWLAHATLLSGLWVDNQQRYDTLASSDRLTLLHAFQRAGWRTVGVHPGVTLPLDYRAAGYDAFYMNQDMGYQGPSLTWNHVPDQYTLSFFERAARSGESEQPVMGELGLLSGHLPWFQPPQLVDWDAVGDGSIFHGMESESDPQEAMATDPDRARPAYVKAIAYSVRTIVSYLETFGDDDLVMIIVGDHQPASVVTGSGASHDVPISIVSRDPAVLDRIAGWGWTPSLRPDPAAPVWPMDGFRDRFLTAYGSPP